MKNKLELKFSKNWEKSTIIVEAGHIYTNEQPTLEHKIGIDLGRQLSDCLIFFGVEVKKWLFIDDYNPQFEKTPQNLNVENYISSLYQSGFIPDKVIYESDLVEHAKNILVYLQNECYASQDVNGKTILNKEKILLYDKKNEKYMCSLLDACLYLQKLEQADCCITVLSKQYFSQQKGTLTILRKLGADTKRIFPFFYTIPDFKKHMSVDSSNVYITEQVDLSFVQPAIDLLHIVTKLSGSVSHNLSSRIGVEKYDI